MKRLLLAMSFLLLFTTLLSAQWQKKKRLDGEGNVRTEVREVPDFQAIDVGGGIDLYIHQSNERKVEVQTHDNIFEHVTTRVVNGTLIIGMKGTIWIKNIEELRVDVWIDKLEGISAGGGSDVVTEGQFKADQMWVKANGGSDLRLNVSATKLEGASSGGSDLYLSGKVDQLILHTSGGSDVKAYDLEARRVEVNSSGGSDAYVHATDEISITASGASDVHYKGSAKVVHQKSSGSSDIHRN